MFKTLLPAHRTAPHPPTGQTPPSASRSLVLVALAVLTAHALLLTNAPAWLGLAPPTPERPTDRTQAFATRQIAPRPPPAPAPSTATDAAPTPPSVAKTDKTTPQKRIYKPKQALVQDSPAAVATDSIADKPVPEPPSALTQPSDTADIAAASQPLATASAAATAADGAPNALTAPSVPASAAQALPVPTAVTSVVLPASAILNYQMTGSAKGLTYHASAELGWRNGGDRYDARMTVSALFLGSRSMASVGQLDAGGLAPTRFSDKSRSEVAAHFEPDKGLITFSANTPPAPWVKGAQDRVSVFFQISGLIASRPADFPVGTTVVMYTAGPRAADTWAFTVAAEEVLALPYGQVNTLKLRRQPQREYDQTVEIWLAPALNYLPVRNKITQSNGDFIDQQLTGLSRP